jgi:hypothetical protein
MHDLEQRRRDFKNNDPDLYRYISLIESRKSLKTLGDNLSGFSRRAANLAWHFSAVAENNRREMIGLTDAATDH